MILCSLFSKYLSLISLSLSKNTIHSYKSDILPFLQYVECFEVLDKKIVYDYFLNLSKKEYSSSTINRKYSALNTFFKFLIEEGVIQENPISEIKKVKISRKLPKLVFEENIKKIIMYYQKLNNKSEKTLKERAIFYLMIFTGMRVSEICSLKKDTFNFISDDSQYFMISVIGKGSKERILPCNKITIDAVQDFIKFSNKKSIYVFPTTSKFGYISRVSLFKLIKKIMLKLQIDQSISPHMFRHAFATNLLEKDMDLRYIQDILGHASISTTAIYAEVQTKKLKDDLKKFHPEFQDK